MSFTPENPALHEYKCNQHVLIDKRFLINIRGIDYEDEVYDIPDSKDWYAFVNSYYEYAEDFDAVNRIPHLLHEIFSRESLSEESDDEPPTMPMKMPSIDQDPYQERKAQIKYLKRKPKCFIILGKPEIGEQNLGRLLAEYWKCVFIHPETLILEEIMSESKAGMCIEFNLRCGRAVSIDVILRLLEKRMLSKSVEHRGFVLCGFPLISNDLFSEDPVSSESAIFNVHEIFEEFFDTVLDIVDPTEVVKNVSRTSKADILEEEEENEEEEKEIEGEFENRNNLKFELTTDTKVEVKTVPQFDIGSTKEEICYMSNFHADDKNQMNYIFSLCEPHDYIIVYLKCSNDEVVNTRKDNRCDSQTLEIINIQPERSDNLVYKLYSMHAALRDEDMMLNMAQQNRKLLTLQRDFPGHVNSQLEKYLYDSEIVIEKFILLQNPEYVIKLDGRTAPHRMFHALKMRLRVLPISQNLVPELLVSNSPFEEPGEGPPPPPETDYDIMTPEEWLKDLRVKKSAGPLYKWTLSDWGYFCPVAMYNGKYVTGHAKFAVHFMNKIFFLSDEEALLKFTRNPRPFLLPPMPKPRCRIFIIGPKASGKTSIATCLSLLLGGEIIDPETIISNYLNVQRRDIINKVRKIAVRDAIESLKQQRRDKYFEQENERLRKLREYTDILKGYLKEYMDCIFILSDFEETELTSLPSPKLKSKPPEVLKSEENFVILEARLKQYELPVNDLETLRRLYENEDELIPYLPKDCHPPLVFEFDLISESHSFVENFAKEAVELAEENMDMGEADEVTLSRCFKEVLQQIDEDIKRGQCRGWIMDGLPLNTSVLEALIPDSIADIVYILKDSTNGQFLQERFKIKGQNEFRNFYEFFKELDYLDIVAREPSNHEEVLSMGSMKYMFTTGEEDELYQTKINLYNSDYEYFIKFLESNYIEYMEFDVANKTIKDLLVEIIYELEGKHSQAATIFTPEEREVEINDYGEPRIQEEELGGEDIGEDKEQLQNFLENRRLGDTNQYCPVTFEKYGVLWKGKEECGVKYLDKLYFFASEEFMKEFLADPRKYCFNREAPKITPPMRICIVGTKSVGKTTQAKEISKKLGLYYADFEQIIREKLDEFYINQYFDQSNPIDEDVMKSILFPLWFEDPKKATGFVLDGFPRRPSDIEFMTKYATIPDIILELVCPEYDLNARLLGILINEWQIQMDKNKAAEELAHKRAVREWKQQRDLRKNELVAAKRDERYALKMQREINEEALEDEEVEEEEERPKTAKSLLSYKSIEDAEDLKEIEEVLNEELPEPILNDNWESLEMAMDRLQSALIENTSSEPEHLSVLRELSETNEITWTSIDANLTVLKVFNQLMRSLIPIKYRNKSIFERVYDISTELAEKLLEQGYYFLSRFGKSCPVQIYEDYNHIQLFLPKESIFQMFPIIHRNHIYFLAGVENRNKFKKDPLMYTNQKNCKLPLFRLRISLIGPPKCGKTTISERIQLEYGLLHVSIGKAVRYVLKYLSSSILAKKVEELLRKGKQLTDEMTMMCVEAMGYDSKGVALGIVMDGFPNNIHEVRELAKLNLIPHLILDLQTDLKYIYEYMDVMKPTHRPEYSKKFIGHRYEVWNKTGDYFRNWVDKEYQNLGKIPIDPSKWKNWIRTKDLLLAVISEIKFYYKNKRKDMVLRIGNMLVSPYEFLTRQSAFKNYCPLCLFYSNALTYGGNPPDRTGLVQHHAKFYWLCSKHIEEFVENPAAYLDPNIRHTLPINLPRRVLLNEEPDNCYADGMCVICMVEHKPKRVLNQGFLAYAIEYCDKIYLFDSEECLNKFMQTPSAYSSAVVNFKGEVSFPSVDIKNLPTLGLLEQFDASQIIKAIIDTHKNRPLAPGLDIKQSALISMGLFLKIKNPNTPEKYVKLYADAKDNLFNRRDVLMNGIENLRSTINPYLHYEEPFPSFEIDLEYGHTISIKSESESTIIRNVIDDIIDQIEF